VRTNASLVSANYISSPAIALDLYGYKDGSKRQIPKQHEFLPAAACLYWPVDGTEKLKLHRGDGFQETELDGSYTSTRSILGLLQVNLRRQMLEKAHKTWGEIVNDHHNDHIASRSESTRKEEKEKPEATKKPVTKARKQIAKQNSSENGSEDKAEPKNFTQVQQPPSKRKTGTLSAPSPKRARTGKRNNGSARRK